MKKNTLRYAFYKSIPVMTGYLVLGMGFGILLASRGYSFLWAMLMSSTIYAGSMQYVAVDLLSAGASFISAALMTLMVNARHLFYGLSMLEDYKETGKAKPYLIFSLTDETYSLVCAAKLPETIDRKRYYLYLSVLNQCYWVLGSVIGGLIGTLISFDFSGVEFSMTALFVVIFVEQWENAHNHLPAIIGVSVSLLCLFLFGISDFLIPSMAGITICLLLCRKWLDKEAVSHE